MTTILRATRRMLSVLGITVAAVLGTCVAVRACADGATTSELAFAKSWPSCDQDLVRQFQSGWGLTDESWNPAGVRDACNEALPFAKVTNAIALIGGSPTIPGIFHQRADYYQESRANTTPYHDDVYQRFIQDHDGAEAQTDAGDHTDLDCPIFNYPGTPTPDPLTGSNAEMLAERSAVLVHEMWHHWQDANDYDSKHIDGPTGTCTAGDGACDYFYPHGPGSNLPDGTKSNAQGGLNKTVTFLKVGLYFHSPYQVMVEFESDIAIFGSPNFIPFSVRQEAQSVGNGHLTTNFVNAASFSIGNPVPFP